MKEKRREVMPVFNRCVVFNTDANSFHGHPDPLQTPEGVFRRSIALYYYTASKEIYNEVPSTSTIYHARPGDDDTHPPGGAPASRRSAFAAVGAAGPAALRLGAATPAESLNRGNPPAGLDRD